MTEQHTIVRYIQVHNGNLLVVVLGVARAGAAVAGGRGARLGGAAGAPRGAAGAPRLSRRRAPLRLGGPRPAAVPSEISYILHIDRPLLVERFVNIIH